MPTVKEIKDAKAAMLKHLSDKAKTIRAQIEADRAADKRLADAAPAMLEALREAVKLIGCARQYFPGSMHNQDKFLLEQTCAAVCSAIAKAEGK